MTSPSAPIRCEGAAYVGPDQHVSVGSRGEFFGVAPHTWRRWPVTPVTPKAQQLLIAVAVGVLGLGTYLWQLSVPIYLQLYDSGVYLAGAIHLVAGVLPYRDFAFVQPPGILVILSPVAVVSRIFGSHDGLVVARVLSAVVTALDASLLSWLVRARGRVAMIISGAGLALTPVAVFYSSDIRLEPFCVLLVLLGSLEIARQGSASSRTTRSLWRAGRFFGLAAAVEFWAFFAFVAMATCVIPSSRRRALAFVLGAGTGLAAPCLAFLLAAPHGFVSQVFLEQLHHPRVGGTLARRLVDITGLAGTSIAPTGAEALGGFAVLGVLVVVTYRWRPRGGVIEWYLLVASVTCVGGLLTAPAAYTDYGYFAAPFLCGVVGVVTGRLVGALRRGSARVVASTSVRRFVTGVGVVAALVATAGVVSFDATFYSLDLPLTGVSARAITSISRTIPVGSCAIYDTVGVGLVANRFATNDATCPHVSPRVPTWSTPSERPWRGATNGDRPRRAPSPNGART